MWGSLLGKREPAPKYRTVDGGHTAPFPDMTDEQLYNYEQEFHVPRKTFDKPPPGAVPDTELAPTRTKTRGPRIDIPIDTPEFSAHPADAKAAAPPAPAQPAIDTDSAESDVPLDFEKPIRTVTTKQAVEILTTKARHPVYKVHAYIGDDDIVTLFTLDGRLSENGPRFLENAPQKRQLYLNIYRNRDVYAKEKYLVTQHDTRPEADASAQAERLACVAVQLDA
ncbi:MAG TPA: hypothetical protein VJ654_16320 [Noviherbaspirillum sp.]|nr:hypothetical protein [Noviherbaspirillum sp.]